jgi:hypothetical protein
MPEVTDGRPDRGPIGDYRAFTALQCDRLAVRGIDIAPYELSHLAFRVPEWDQYVHLRTLLERHAVAKVEKFHRRSLRAAVELEGRTLDRFYHVDDWIPQRLVTATGPNPLPR